MSTIKHVLVSLFFLTVLALVPLTVSPVNGTVGVSSLCAAQGGSGTCCTSDDTCIYQGECDEECPPPVIVPNAYWFDGGGPCPE